VWGIHSSVGISDQEQIGAEQACKLLDIMGQVHEKLGKNFISALAAMNSSVQQLKVSEIGSKGIGKNTQLVTPLEV